MRFQNPVKRRNCLIQLPLAMLQPPKLDQQFPALCMAPETPFYGGPGLRELAFQTQYYAIFSQCIFMIRANFQSPLNGIQYLFKLDLVFLIKSYAYTL